MFCSKSKENSEYMVLCKQLNKYINIKQTTQVLFTIQQQILISYTISYLLRPFLTLPYLIAKARDRSVRYRDYFSWFKSWVSDLHETRFWVNIYEFSSIPRCCCVDLKQRDWWSHSMYCKLYTNACFIMLWPKRKKVCLSHTYAQKYVDLFLLHYPSRWAQLLFF